MAEALAVVGAVASVIQLVDFTTRVFERVKLYIHRVDEAPDTLRDIGIHLPLFIDALHRIQFHIDFGHFNPQTSAALKILIDECFSQMIVLDDLMTKLTPKLVDSKLTKTRKAILSLRDEKTLEKIFSKISGYIKMLLLYQNSITSTHTMVNTRVMLKQLENASSLEKTTSINSVAMTGDSQSISIDNSQSRVASKCLPNYIKHNKQRRLSYFIGLARFGFLWAFQADLDLSWGNSGLSISPSLHFQQLVKNTSPGFQLVWKCYYHGADVQTSCHKLVKLFQTGVASPLDIFPNGSTWLERLLDNFKLNPNIVLEFVNILCKSGASKTAKKPLLSLVAGWNLFGIHLKLLKELLASGYDCSTDTTYTDLGETWLGLRVSQPRGFSTFPMRPGSDSDPFLLKFLMKCSENSYGVWGQTPLIDSVLCGSTSNVSAFLEHPGCLRGSNVLGQTAAHVAVLRPDVLSLLLKAYSDFDVVDFDGFDSYGNSPLVYAAAYGYIESVLLLLKAGANPLKEGHLEFLQWALVWENWDVATASFAFFRTAGRFSDAFLQSELNSLIIGKPGIMPWWWSQAHWQKSSELLEKMLNLGVDKHMLFEDGSTLLHYAPDSKWIDALFNAGFQRIDQSNIKGETALMTLVLRQSHMARNILARGCNVNHRDNRGETALQKAFTRGILRLVHTSHNEGTESFESSSLEILSSDFAVIAELLHERADISIYDNCRCPCAPHGCSPLRRLLCQNGQLMGYIWILEFLLMLDEIQGRAIAQREVLGLKRVREFNLADMTHVCGNVKSTRVHEPMGDAEVDEIIDEEEEFVANLDKKMQETSSHENESIEESWLSLIADFWTPDSPVKRQKLWTSWDPVTMYSDEKFGMTSSTLMRSYGTRGQDLSHFEEVTDKFWTLEPLTFHGYVPQSSVYSTWVEWVYQNPDKYDYPRPVDRNWYEKRKYWATRQAEVLEELSQSTK